jgi:microcin C transport system substrate-binding protein
LPKIPAVEKGWLVRQKIYNDAPVGTQGIALNQRDPVLKDVKVRKALQFLLDREKMIRTLAYNEYRPLYSYYQGGEYQNPGNEKIKYDPEEAFELLKEAGYTKRGSDGILVKGEERLSVSLGYSNALFEKYLTTYVEDCKKVGVEIKLVRENRETAWKNLMDRKFQSFTMAWGALVFPNPETSFAGSLADQNDNNNITGVKIPRCDELFKAYDVAFTQDERRKIIREIDGLVYKDFPYVLFWYQPCQRVLYWNKYGMPEFGFHRTSEWEDAFGTWWVDPAKEKALEAARAADKTLSIPPLEVKGWEKKAAK